MMNTSNPTASNNATLSGLHSFTSLPNRTILITGGSKGIGLALAKRFSQEHWRVIICASTQASLDEALLECPGLHTFVCDLYDTSQIHKLAELINAQYGALDILINNAGVYLPGQIHSEDDDALDKMFNLNVKSAYTLTKKLLPPMMAKKSGSIFNMCSVASIMPYINGGSYCISKFALLGFSKVLREEMKGYQIKVTSVLPGATLTASWDGVDLPEERFMPPEDVAEIIYSSYQMSSRTVIEEIVLRPMLGDL